MFLRQTALACRKIHFHLLLIVVFSLSAFLFGATKPGFAVADIKQVLFLPSYNYDYPAIRLFEQGMRAGFAEQQDIKVAFSFENLRLADHPNNERYYAQMAAALKMKYQDRKPDLIIAHYKQAATFLGRFGHEIFGDKVPVVLAGIESEDYRNFRFPANFTGVATTYNIRRNLDLILQLHPKTKTVYVVAGLSSNVVNDAIKETANYKDRLKIVIWNTLPFDRILEEAARLPKDAAIIYTAMQVDVSGKRYIPAAAARELAVRANAPVYGMLDTYAETGILGGFLLSNKGLGLRAAQIGADILRATATPDAKMRNEAIGSYEFDWRQLKRWQVPESALPPGSIVNYKQLSIWEQYQWEISGGIALIALQVFLIAGLLISRSRRKMAEYVLLKAQKELQASEEKYRLALEQSSDAIVIVDPVTKTALYTNQRWRNMMGYAEDEAKRLTSYDVVAHNKGWINDSYQALLQGNGQSTQFIKYIRKDGRIIEVEKSCSVIDYAGAKALLFASRDVTRERKLQELLTKDLLLAAEVQTSLLPTGFTDTLLSVETIYAPYHLVSGDFFDYIWNPEHTKFSGFVLDVSGHGVTSSLQGIAVSAYFRDTLQSPMHLAAKLQWINRQVLKYFTEDTFAAAICFEFDFRSNILSVAMAGVYGFLSHSAALPTVVKRAGSLIGISETPEYTEWSVPIQPGDAFYFMSDGIFEQIDEQRDLPLHDFSRALAALRTLTEKPDKKDDCCAVCVRVSGQPSFPLRLDFFRPGEYSRIRSRLHELLKQTAGIHAGRIDVAVGEALNNAARESMDVKVKFNLIGKFVVIRVRDGGAGFNGNARVAAFLNADPEQGFDADLYAEGGRGIKIMASWMDRVVYNRQGNEVLLVKNIAAL
jgi:PAS domain S-box-containing protein